MDNQLHLRTLERFDALLKQPRTKEKEWQRLFADYPYILSTALPLQLKPSQIIPLATPGRAETDFAIQPDPMWPGSPRGLIELKRPDQRVLKLPRNGIVSLYDDAHTAKRQVEEHAKDYPWRPDSVLILGDDVYKFVIMGLSRTWADILANDFLRAQLSGLFGGVRFFGYDQIFESYRRGLPERLLLLVPSPVGVLRAEERQYIESNTPDRPNEKWEDARDEFIRQAKGLMEENYAAHRYRFKTPENAGIRKGTAKRLLNGCLTVIDFDSFGNRRPSGVHRPAFPDNGCEQCGAFTWLRCSSNWARNPQDAYDEHTYICLGTPEQPCDHYWYLEGDSEGPFFGHEPKAQSLLDRE